MKPYRKLRGRMAEYDMKQSDIAEMLNKSHTYITQRINGHANFDLLEVYEICDRLEIPYEEIPIYFPRDGIGKAV